jgi:hypothetical protein
MNDAQLQATLARTLDVLKGINVRMDSLERNRDAVAVARESARLSRADALAERKREEARIAEEERQERFRQRRIKDREDGKFAKCAQIFNDALQPFGRTVPPARDDQSYYPYLRQCTDIAARYMNPSNKYSRYDYTSPDHVPLDILVNFSDHVLKGVRDAVRDPDTVAKGTMREIVNRDPATNAVTSREFVSKECFVKAMGRPGRRVVSWYGGTGSNGMPLPRLS